MASKFFRAFNTIVRKLPGNKSKVAPTVTQPRQLKTTMKKIRSQFERHGYDRPKTAQGRANIVRRKKSIERMNKLQKEQDTRKKGIKASKEVKKMIGTGQADRVGSSVYHRGVREKKAMGGVMNAINKLRGKEEKKKPEKGKDSIKEKILPKKKKERLEQLKKELGMRKGGKAKFPDLTGDGKVTRADILKGRGVFRKGGATRPTGKVLEAIKQDYKKNKPPKGSKKPGRK